jgi:hypothetical protein
MAQPTGPNYRFCHYAKGDKSERLPLGLQPVLGNETTPAVRLTSTSTTYGEPRFACETFSPEKGNAHESADACANEGSRRFNSAPLRQRVTANRYPVVASFRVGTATAERLTQCE